jgi:hypothetical protein
MSRNDVDGFWPDVNVIRVDKCFLVSRNDRREDVNVVRIEV